MPFFGHKQHGLVHFSHSPPVFDQVSCLSSRDSLFHGYPSPQNRREAIAKRRLPCLKGQQLLFKNKYFSNAPVCLHNQLALMETLLGPLMGEGAGALDVTCQF